MKIVILIAGILWGFLGGNILTTSLTTTKPITPTITIQTENVNGIIKSDTTYVYRK